MSRDDANPFALFQNCGKIINEGFEPAAKSFVMAKAGGKIIIGFAFVTPEEAAGLKPKVVVLDEDNKIISNV